MASRGSALVQAQDALARHAWAEARALFEEALRHEESAAAHEGLSWAAWWLNDAETVFASREAAHRLYGQCGDDHGAARMAMWLAADYVDFRGEVPVASGWQQRTRRLLEDLPLAPEHGWARLLEGDFAIMIENDPATARRCADEVISIGRQLGISEFGVLGLALDGLALVNEGDVDKGMKELNEAAVTVLNEGIEPPFWVSWVLCYTLFACERARDFDSAIAWCERTRRIADQLQMAPAQGICRVHYAAVHIWRGKWDEAEKELAEASERLRASRPPWAAEAFVRLADLRWRQGRLDEAAAIFHEVEFHPMALFGLAELALESGKPKDAEELVERARRQIPESNRHLHAAALELLVRAEALLGNHTRTVAALDELRAISAVIASVPLQAATKFSAGIAAVKAADYEEAMRHFEDAIGLFERTQAPYESSRARLELASVLVALDRLDRARVEADASRQVLEKLGSRIYARRAAALLADIERRAAPANGKPDDNLLTARQVDILRLISRGMSDREIAMALGLSEHTVHRHVANILLRLDLPSRAAAAAHAASRGLI